MDSIWISHVRHSGNINILDVTDRIIAMGYPGGGLESVYRNSMKDVQEFFKKKHTGFYKVYNLCTERSYSDKCFDRVSHSFRFDRVSHNFRFDDHNPPPFDLLFKFCEDIVSLLVTHMVIIGHLVKGRR
jgi:phosphatidylinositol-3,4,5-trisphosphate 3-phosphatase/dual-specificity protein phosphatase PTEN